MTTPDPNGGSEYGGVPGLVQPPPHEPTASEKLSALYAIEPTDALTVPPDVT
jgi:hypothetical protein